MNELAHHQLFLVVFIVSVIIIIYNNIQNI